MYYTSAGRRYDVTLARLLWNCPSLKKSSRRVFPRNNIKIVHLRSVYSNLLPRQHQITEIATATIRGINNNSQQPQHGCWTRSCSVFLRNHGTPLEFAVNAATVIFFSASWDLLYHRSVVPSTVCACKCFLADRAHKGRSSHSRIAVRVRTTVAARPNGFASGRRGVTIVTIHFIIIIVEQNFPHGNSRNDRTKRFDFGCVREFRSRRDCSMERA